MASDARGRALSESLEPLPGDISAEVADWVAGLPAASAKAIGAVLPTLGPLFSNSPYLFSLAQTQDVWLAGALGLDIADIPGTLVAAAACPQGPLEEEAAIVHRLRVAKARAALILAIAETGRAMPTLATGEALSDFADAAIDAALDYAVRFQVKDLDSADAEVLRAGKCGLAIFALGKQGGRDLNFSSDIDIVAFFDSQAALPVDSDKREDFYVHVVRRVVGLIDERTADGYVFRTDIRLRPDPGSTPVALSTEAALTYYEGRGQNWERAAWIKARVCAGDRAVGERFLLDLAPFIWRKHLDFATIADIQAMKRQINVSRNIGDIGVGGHNVKLGRGGIREIEFFAQTQQLIAGGRDAALRVRPTQAALGMLAGAGWIAEATADQLVEAYWFLRAVENRLQMVNDAQTHSIPVDENAIRALAQMMGIDGETEFSSRYRSILASVSASYAELFVEGAPLASDVGNLVFTGGEDDPATIETLATMGFTEGPLASATIRKWHYGGYAATRASAARAHLTEFVPTLLVALIATGSPDAALARFDHFLSRFPAGVQLFSLLRQHSQLTAMLLAFMASAPRMAEAVINRVHVMDGLLDPAFSAGVTDRSVLIEKVADFLADARGYEDVIDRARIVGQEQKFLIAAGLVSRTVDAALAGAQFSVLAETLLTNIFGFVRRAFAETHGDLPGSRAALLAFGKLASGEMTVTSDLDFILLYDVSEGIDQSDGERPLAPEHYFARLTQRLVAALSAPTAEGVLYETDMRLRPSGNAGPLATSIAAFSNYQTENAWTWEHLALSRARVVCEERGLGGEIESLIGKILGAPHDSGKVTDDVVSMRALMAKERKPRHPFDLKLVEGGMVDIEFLAQSAQLILGDKIGLPQAPPRAVIARLGELGVLAASDRVLEIHALYGLIVQVMSVCLVNPFRAEEWTSAFKGLVAALANAPDFGHLEIEVEQARREIVAISTDWYGFLRNQG